MSSFVQSGVTWDFDGTPPAELPEDSNPIVVFRSLRNTLVNVSAHMLKANVRTARTAGIVYPYVRTLRLKTSAPIHSAHYARAFPNVASLRFSCIQHGGIDEEERDELAVIREGNRNLLRQHGEVNLLQHILAVSALDCHPLAARLARSSESSWETVSSDDCDRYKRIPASGQPLSVIDCELLSSPNASYLIGFLFERGYLLWLHSSIVSGAVERFLAFDPDAFTQVVFINYLSISEAGHLTR
ncbi:hypothetical protein L226DRAFT_576055 [Lentinus tigrinus ALCF2SS1-7]|uniref:uncharacterized protein n=1 Tax=Lentinus tigrinus ALCF2SS1-7 TaxID=1328758 RepID=UPI001165CC9B|nr:hypothetical protein L226DRAFT_576055 [Lentinus tigrinus ALCF2SS1-7]